MPDIHEETKAYHKDMENLKADLANLRADMSKMIGSVVELGKESSVSAREKLQAEVDERLRQLNSAYASARESGAGAMDEFQKKVEERPMTSILIALGVGVVIGKIMSKE